MIIADTSELLAYFNNAEPRHADVASVVDSATEPLVVSTYVIAELDRLVATRHGVEAELAVLAERTHTRRILTLDHSHFEVLRPRGGGRFSLLPGS